MTEREMIIHVYMYMYVILFFVLCLSSFPPLSLSLPLECQ